MPSSALQDLRYRDIGALKPALYSLCSRFGSVSRLDIVSASQAGQNRAVCFLRMGSPEQEARLMNELGVGRFGGDLVMVLDLQPTDSGTSAVPGLLSPFNSPVAYMK